MGWKRSAGASSLGGCLSVWVASLERGLRCLSHTRCSVCLSLQDAALSEESGNTVSAQSSRTNAPFHRPEPLVNVCVCVCLLQ